MYSDQLAVGALGVDLAKKYCAQMGRQLQLVEDKEFQLTKGDAIIIAPGIGWCNLEIKAELTWTGNLFIEDVSNANIGRAGWLHNLTDCHVLFYTFPVHRHIFALDFKLLQKTDFSSFKRKSQKKHTQQNETQGLIVPVGDIKKMPAFMWDYRFP